jgi:hypothetical protein
MRSDFFTDRFGTDGAKLSSESPLAVTTASAHGDLVCLTKEKNTSSHKGQDEGSKLNQPVRQ